MRMTFISKLILFALALAEGGVVHVGARPREQVPVEDEHAHGTPLYEARRPWPLLRSAAMSGQTYRLRAPSSGREILLEAEPGRVYRDRETGEELEIVGKMLPLAPSRSRLPWAVETLRFCNWCDQPAQRDLNDCPTCGRRMSALPRVVEE